MEQEKMENTENTEKTVGEREENKMISAVSTARFNPLAYSFSRPYRLSRSAASAACRLPVSSRLTSTLQRVEHCLPCRTKKISFIAFILLFY